MDRRTDRQKKHETTVEHESKISQLTHKLAAVTSYSKRLTFELVTELLTTLKNDD